MSDPKTATAPDRDAQLVKYQPMVRRMAYHLLSRLPASVEVDDLIQVGMMGLVEAIDRCEPAQGVFEGFASQRIRGAMLDQLRDNDWMSRDARRNLKTIDRTIGRLQQQLCRTPADSEVARAMDLDLPTYQRVLGRVHSHQMVHLDDVEGCSEEDDTSLDAGLRDAGADPLSMLEEQRLRMALVDAIQQLPEREQQVMTCYYVKDMKLKDIARQLGVSESRVSQMHSHAVSVLRSQLRSH